MKRFRVKIVGLGLALAAGTAVGGDRYDRGPGQPALLPASVRTPTPAPKSNSPTIWLPAREPAAPPLILPASGVTAPEPVVPLVTPAAPPAIPGGSDPLVGPRARGGSEPLLAIPALPDVPAVPELPPQPPGPMAKQPDPVPPPRPLDPKPGDPPKMLPPHAPDFLPPPRPTDGQPELQPAPASMMVPHGMEVGGKHTTFGSLPIRLSRDYPPLRDLIGHGHAHDDLTLAGDGDGPSALRRGFVRGEFLLWWMPGFPVPVLATTNPNTALNGYLGEPGTTAIVGPGGFVGSTRAGFRIRAGAWLDDCGTCGIDAGFFFLGNRSATSVVNSDQFPLITRPVFVPNLIPGTNTPLGENGEAVAVPGILSGVLTTRGDSRLWGADVNLRKNLLCRCDVRAEWFVGYRHLNLRESLTITEDITVIGAGGMRINTTDPVGTRVLVQDQFVTRNQFHGGQIGAVYERRMGRWEWDARGSIAFGNNHQILDINGAQVRQQPGADSMTFTGGLLAAGPNLGRFTRDRFSVAPEFTLNMGYWVTPSIRVFAGYNFLLWTNVIRPGDQIDRVVDLTFVPNSLPAAFSGQPRPQPLFTQRDLVINGVQFGVDWRW